MTLHLEGGLARGTLAIDMDLAVGRETVALVGPNGAGKSTTLKLIAGLLRLDRGSLRCDDDDWDDGAGRFTVSEDRRVAWLPQDPLLFPHLDVLSNVAFGPRSRGASRTDASQLAAAMLERLDAAKHVFDVRAVDPSRYAARPRLISTLSGAITDSQEIEIEEHAQNGDPPTRMRLQPHRLVIDPPRVRLLAFPVGPQAAEPVLLDIEKIAKVTPLDTTFTPRPLRPEDLPK